MPFIPPAVLLVVAAAAQVPASVPSASPMAATPPPVVAGYVATLEVRAIAPELQAKGTSEAAALAAALKKPTALVTRAWLAQDLSRQEVLSSDVMLPVGTLIMHRAGDRAYLIADPKAKTYAVMDAVALLDLVEGSVGATESQYDAKVRHLDEKKTIAGYPARKSVVSVSYVAEVPYESSTVRVQRTNDIEIWHTSALVSAAAMDHFFFKFQRDQTGAVRKALAADIGFPLEVRMIVTQGTGAKASVQPGSIHLQVTEVKKDTRLDSELFRMPPAGYRRVERMPFAVSAPAR